jgi:predicted lipase
MKAIKKPDKGLYTKQYFKILIRDSRECNGKQGKHKIIPAFLASSIN